MTTTPIKSPRAAKGRRWIARRCRWYVLKTRRQPGTVNYLASSMALGVLLAFVIPPGLQMLAAVLAATLLRCNRWIAVSAVWITNPLTMPFIYAGAYVLGTLITGSTLADDAHSGDLWSDIMNPETPGEALLALLTGLVLLGVVGAALSYVAVHYSLVRSPRRPPQQSPQS